MSIFFGIPVCDVLYCIPIVLTIAKRGGDGDEIAAQL